MSVKTDPELNDKVDNKQSNRQGRKTPRKEWLGSIQGQGLIMLTHLSINRIDMTITTGAGLTTDIDVAEGGGDEGGKFVYAQPTR